MKLIDIINQSYETAEDKGWHDHGSDGPTPEWVGAKLALVHSEISEALEEVRSYWPDLGTNITRGKPEGFLVELADAIIRIGDLAACLGMADALVESIRMKMEYNETRPHRHGGKTL